METQFADLSKITPEMIALFMKDKVGTINAITEVVDKKSTEKFEANKDFGMVADLKRQRDAKAKIAAEEEKLLLEETKNNTTDQE